MKKIILFLTISLSLIAYKAPAQITLTSISLATSCTKPHAVTFPFQSDEITLMSGIYCGEIGSTTGPSQGTLLTTGWPVTAPIDSLCGVAHDITFGFQNDMITLLSGIYCAGGGGGGSGTVTNVATGYGLSGGPITTTGTLKADTTQITTQYYVNTLVNSLTATNGLHESPANNFKLGGTIIENTTIDKTGATDYQLNITDNSAHSNPSLNITGGSFGLNSSGTNFGVVGTSASIPLWSINNSSNNNNVEAGLVLNRSAAPAANAGSGSYIQTNLSNHIGGTITASRILTTWTNAASTFETSKLALWTTNSNVLTSKLEINGNGSIKLNSYGAGTNTGTAAYGLSVDASGNIIETQPIVSYKQAITALQAQTLSSVPVDVADLPAPGAGYAWEIITMSVKYTFVTTDYLATTLGIITETATTSAFQVQNNAPCGIGGVSAWTRGVDPGGAKTEIIENKKMQIQSDVDDPLGDGTFIIYGTARLIKL